MSPYSKGWGGGWTWDLWNAWGLGVCACRLLRDPLDPHIPFLILGIVTVCEENPFTAPQGHSGLSAKDIMQVFFCAPYPNVKISTAAKVQSFHSLKAHSLLKYYLMISYEVIRHTCERPSSIVAHFQIHYRVCVPANFGHPARTSLFQVYALYRCCKHATRKINHHSKAETIL